LPESTQYNVEKQKKEEGKRKLLENARDQKEGMNRMATRSASLDREGRGIILNKIMAPTGKKTVISEPATSQELRRLGRSSRDTPPTMPSGRAGWRKQTGSAEQRELGGP